MTYVEAGVTPIGFIETNVLFAIAVLALSLKTDLKDFQQIFTSHNDFWWGVSCQHLVMPIIVSLGSFFILLPLGNSTGLMIISAMPAVVFGALLTNLARGNVALSLVIILISCPISAVFAPAVIQMWASWNPAAAQDASLANYTPIYSLKVGLSAILIPMILGLVFGYLFPRIRVIGTYLAQTCFVIALIFPLGIIYSNSEAIINSIFNIALPIGLIYFSSILFIFKLADSINISKPSIYSIAFTAATQNVGIAGMFAMAGLSNDSTHVLTAFWWVIFQYYGGICIALYCRKATKAHESSLCSEQTT